MLSSIGTVILGEKKKKIKEDDFNKKIKKLIDAYDDSLSCVIRSKKKEVTGESFIKINLELNSVVKERNKFQYYIQDHLIGIHGFTINSLYKILYEFKWSGDCNFILSNIIKNPYEFIRFKKSLLTFKKAEKINMYENLDTPIETRIDKWIIFNFHDEKNLYLKPSRITKNFKEWCHNNKLNYDKTILEKYVKINKSNGEGYWRYTTDYIIKFEKEMGDKIIKLFINEDDTLKENLYYNKTIVNKTIIDYEEENNLKLNKKQKEAIHKSIKYKFAIISGFPGTGKSTIIDVIGHYLCDHKNFGKNPNKHHISLMAPTGLAIKGLCAKCNFEYNNAYTIHKTLINHKNRFDYKKTQEYREADKEEKEFLENINKMKKSEDIIVIDESSMIDIMLFEQILDYCQEKKCALILVGDINQLPPIGLGAPFEALIQTPIFEETRVSLRTIKRQKGILSKNIKNMNINKMKISDFDDDSMLFIERDNITTEVLKKILQDIYNKEGDFQLITPQKQYDAGVINCNKLLQDIMNKIKKGAPINKVVAKKRIYNNMIEFKENDKIIRIENDYSGETFYANGDEATIINENKITNEIIIKYLCDNKLVKYKECDLEEFDLFYASTVHKMQGSQKPVIVIPMSSAHCMWRGQDKLKLLYTAVSRAQQKCIIVGSKDTFEDVLKYNKSGKESIFMKQFNIIDDLS
jgi:ATP-dependent exoDNAse (exonuclease V) alpha subunit